MSRAWKLAVSQHNPMMHSHCTCNPQDLQRALTTLEPLELNAETEAQWAQLAAVALEHEALAVAERCYAALGDVAKTRYLHKVSLAVVQWVASAINSGWHLQL